MADTDGAEVVGAGAPKPVRRRQRSWLRTVASRSEFDRRVQDMLRAFDVNADDRLDVSEVTRFAEYVVHKEVHARWLLYFVVGLAVLATVLLATTGGLIYAVGNALKDTRVDNAGVMTSRSSDRNVVMVASTDYAVDTGGELVTRRAGSITNRSDVIVTSTFVGLDMEFASDIDDLDLMELKYITITLDDDTNTTLRVMGVSRSAKEDSVNGVVVDIKTDSGVITVDDVIVTVSPESASFLRRTSRVASVARSKGMFNRLRTRNTTEDVRRLPTASMNPAHDAMWDVVPPDAQTKEDVRAIVKNSQLFRVFQTDDVEEQNRALVQAFVNFTSSSNKSYTTQWERRRAFAAFKKNAKRMIASNVDEDQDGWFTLNAFSDMDFTDFAGRVLMEPVDADAVAADTTEGAATDDAESIPTAPLYVNWKDWGAVTPVRDQGMCGSCYIFASVAAIESAYLQVYGPNATNRLTRGRVQNTTFDASEQHVLSCMKGPLYASSQGCVGGTVVDVLDYANSQFLVREADMPYNNGTFSSRTIPRCPSIVGASKIRPSRGSIAFRTFSEQTLMSRLSRGPVVFFMTVTEDFFMYRGGIYSPVRCKPGMRVNHVMLMYGYDVRDPAKKHWLVKNSWGTKWGENGFARLQFTGDRFGPCNAYTALYFSPPIPFLERL